DFTHKNDIRVVAQNRAQPASKREPSLLGHLNLVHPPELVLNGVLDRNDLPDRIVDFMERRIEGGSLATAGGPGNEYDSMGQAEDVAERLEFPRVHPQFAHATQGRALSQQAHHHRLTVEHRYHGYTNVHFVAFQPNLDAAVLRQAFLRDIE